MQLSVLSSILTVVLRQSEDHSFDEILARARPHLCGAVFAKTTEAEVRHDLECLCRDGYVLITTPDIHPALLKHVWRATARFRLTSKGHTARCASMYLPRESQIRDERVKWK